MGLFGFKTKYDINPNVEDFKSVVTNYNLVDVIKMNAKVNVPAGYWFLIGKRGKALDCFSEGEYFLNNANLPYTCRRYNIDRVKKGKSKDKFPANFYFISKALRPGYFKTYRKAEMGTKAYGLFSAKVHGVFSYTVCNVKEFMQSLLNEYDYIKTGEAEEIVNSWVGDVVVKELEHKRFILPDIIANSDIVMDSLKTAVKNMLNTAGIELKDFKVTKYDLPKEYQAQSDKYLAMQNNEGAEKEVAKSSSDLQDDLVYDDNDAPLSQISDYKAENGHGLLDADNGLNDAIKDGVGGIKVTNSGSEYVPFGNFVITSAGLQSKESTANTTNEKQETFVHEQVQKSNNQTADSKVKYKTFVDSSLNELYNNNQNIKRCLNCGAENSPNAKKCILCGESFLDD